MLSATSPLVYTLPVVVSMNILFKPVGLSSITFNRGFLLKGSPHKKSATTKNIISYGLPKRLRASFLSPFWYLGVKEKTKLRSQPYKKA